MSFTSEQVESLRSLANEEWLNTNENRYVKIMLEIASDTIESLSAGLLTANEELSARDVREWVPCNKKTPEAEKFYMVTYRFEDETFLKCHELYYGTADGRTEPGWYLGDDYEELYKPFTVIAWQHLPEPYNPQ